MACAPQVTLDFWKAENTRRCLASAGALCSAMIANVTAPTGLTGHGGGLNYSFWILVSRMFLRERRLLRVPLVDLSQGICLSVSTTHRWRYKPRPFLSVPKS